MEEVVTSDLTKFGFRELDMAADLLKAYANNKNSVDFGDGVNVFMNTNSGSVFLSDEDFTVGMLEDGKVVQFYSCPNCGNEGTQEDGKQEGYDFEKYEGFCTRKCQKA